VPRRRTTRRSTTRSTRRSGDILVKVARTGGVVTEVALNGDITVEAALDIANIGHSPKDRVRVNGREADFDTELEDGDIVTVAGKIEGGK
jgi:hypothetical protein